MSDLLERTLQGLRQAVAVSPDNGPLWLQIAELLAELGRRNEAVEACREDLRFLPEGDARDRADTLRETLQPRLTATGEPRTEGANVFQIVRGGRDASDKPAPLTVLDRERTTFADVGGLDDVKETIRLK